jgi:hypothetical protein
MLGEFRTMALLELIKGFGFGTIIECDRFCGRLHHCKMLLIDRLPKKNLYFFLKVQLKISLNPKFQNFRVTR